MSTPNRWAIRDAGIVTFWDLVSGKPVATLKTLKTSGLETTGETVYARGGFGNPKLVGFSGDRETALTLQDAIFDNKSLAMLTGNDLVEGAHEIAKFDEGVTVEDNTDIVFTLEATPVGGVTVFQREPDGTLGVEIDSSDYTLVGKELVFDSIAADTPIAVYYAVTTDATAKRLKVTSDAFGGTFRVTIDTLVRDAYTKKDFKAQIEVPNAKFEDNFSIDLAVDGNLKIAV